MNIIESVKNFILTCPYLDALKQVNVNFLPDKPDTYSIEEIPTEPVIRTFVDGSSERQFVFVFASRLHYSDEIRNNIDNSGFFESFQNWLDECTECGNLPKMADNLTPYKIEAQSSGYLFDINGDFQNARYQIQCRLLYDKEK